MKHASEHKIPVIKIVPFWNKVTGSCLRLFASIFQPPFIYKQIKYD